MSYSRTLGTAAAAGLLLLFSAWYVLSPYLFLKSLAFAARNADRNALAEDVDFPSVRQGLDEQLDSLVALRAERRQERQSGFEKAVQAFLPALGHQIINAIVTPDGVATLLRQRVKRANDGTGRPSLWQGHMAWLGPSHVRVTYEDQRHPDRPFGLELRRQRLFSWQVTRLDLPLKEIAGLSP